MHRDSGMVQAVRIPEGAKAGAMTPDDLLQAWVNIIRDIFGKRGQFRDEFITQAEWTQCEERFATLVAMNKPKAPKENADGH